MFVNKYLPYSEDICLQTLFLLTLNKRILCFISLVTSLISLLCVTMGPGGNFKDKEVFLEAFITLPKLRDSNNVNRNFMLTMQLFKDIFRHDSCHHQFNVFPFSTVLNTFTV